MRWLSTANFLRGSWLSSHTSFSGVNKCLVQGWVGGIWQLLLQKPSSWCGKEKETAKNKWNGEEEEEEEEEEKHRCQFFSYGSTGLEGQKLCLTGWIAPISTQPACHHPVLNMLPLLFSLSATPPPTPISLKEHDSWGLVYGVLRCRQQGSGMARALSHYSAWVWLHVHVHLGVACWTACCMSVSWHRSDFRGVGNLPCMCFPYDEAVKCFSVWCDHYG